MTYRVEFTKAADRAFCKLEKSVQAQLQKEIRLLAAEPRPSKCKKLKGAANRWRIRSGNYRMVYEVHDGVLLILILDVGHRKDIYN
jgi:mRNA interferase RelE/StbE